jgi:hypothetical protein
LVPEGEKIKQRDARSDGIETNSELQLLDPGQLHAMFLVPVVVVVVVLSGVQGEGVAEGRGTGVVVRLPDVMSCGKELVGRGAGHLQQREGTHAGPVPQQLEEPLQDVSGRGSQHLTPLAVDDVADLFRDALRATPSDPHVHVGPQGGQGAELVLHALPGEREEAPLPLLQGRLAAPGLLVGADGDGGGEEEEEEGHLARERLARTGEAREDNLRASWEMRVGLCGAGRQL